MNRGHIRYPSRDCNIPPQHPSPKIRHQTVSTMFCLRRYGLLALLPPPPVQLPSLAPSSRVIREPKLTMSPPVCSWLPLLFIPTNASPAFIFLFFVCTYFLNRPCIYCSFLLLILFMTSCNWSDRCFFDFSSNWFQPRPGVSYFTDGTASFTCAEAGGCAGAAGGAAAGGGGGGGAAALSAVENMTATANATYLVAKDTVNATANAMMGAAAEQVAQARSEWTGIGMEWLRTLLGKREWRIECLDVYIRL